MARPGHPREGSHERNLPSVPWTLSDSHLSAQFVHQPRAALYASALRDARREVYRRTLVRSHLTRDLEERAVLQASAARMHDLVYGEDPRSPE